MRVRTYDVARLGVCWFPRPVRSGPVTPRRTATPIASLASFSLDSSYKGCVVLYVCRPIVCVRTGMQRRYTCGAASPLLVYYTVHCMHVRAYIRIAGCNCNTVVEAAAAWLVVSAAAARSSWATVEPPAPDPAWSNVKVVVAARGQLQRRLT